MANKKPRCTVTTKEGTRCQLPIQRDGLCHVHIKVKERAKEVAEALKHASSINAHPTPNASIWKSAAIVFATILFVAIVYLVKLYAPPHALAVLSFSGLVLSITLFVDTHLTSPYRLIATGFITENSHVDFRTFEYHTIRYLMSFFQSKSGDLSFLRTFAFTLLGTSLILCLGVILSAAEGRDGLVQPPFFILLPFAIFVLFTANLSAPSDYFSLRITHFLFRKPQEKFLKTILLILTDITVSLWVSCIISVSVLTISYLVIQSYGENMRELVVSLTIPMQAMALVTVTLSTIVSFIQLLLLLIGCVAGRLLFGSILGGLRIFGTFIPLDRYPFSITVLPALTLFIIAYAACLAIWP